MHLGFSITLVASVCAFLLSTRAIGAFIAPVIGTAEATASPAEQRVDVFAFGCDFARGTEEIAIWAFYGCSRKVRRTEEPLASGSGITMLLCFNRCCRMPRLCSLVKSSNLA